MIQKRASHIALAILLAVSLPDLLAADELRVAGVFTDNAVLQQGVTLPVWGTTTSGETVTVRLAGKTKTVQAAEDGSWRVELSPLKSESTGISMIVESGDQREEFRNLLVGEVWYASGQSNMQMKLDSCGKKIPEFREIIDATATEDIRVLRIDEADSPQPLSRRQQATAWQIDDPANRGKQSAVAYFFARALYEKLGVPIGIIEGSWGGKPIEGFIPRAQFEQHDSLQPMLSLAEQGKLDELAKLKGGVIVRNTAGMPGRIFNARVAPIAPYAVRRIHLVPGRVERWAGRRPSQLQDQDAGARRWLASDLGSARTTVLFRATTGI